MFVKDKEKKEITIKQRKTYGYLRIIIGAYLILTAYNMISDLRAGIVADNPKLVVGMAIVFVLVGAFFAISAFARVFRLTAQELKAAEENDKEAECLDESQNEKNEE